MEKSKKSDWKLDSFQLWMPTNSLHYVDDRLFESENEKFACLFYEIDEYRMGWHGSLVGIFENKNQPILITNPENQWFDYNSNSPVIFSNNFLFLRKLAYNDDECLSGTPFVVFDLNKKLFGFIDFDVSSIYYSPEKIQGSLYKFNLDQPDGLKRMRVKFPNRENETFDLKSIAFYSFDKLPRLLDIYFDLKK